MATANDIYNANVKKDCDHWEIRWNISKHIYEFDIEQHDSDVEFPNIVMKEVMCYVIDERRHVDIISVWFNEQPVMIVQNAGREGRDYNERFVTNHQLFTEMLQYIVSQCVTTIEYSGNDIELDVDVPELTNFYGYNWDDEIK